MLNLTEADLSTTDTNRTIPPIYREGSTVETLFCDLIHNLARVVDALNRNGGAMQVWDLAYITGLPAGMIYLLAMRSRKLKRRGRCSIEVARRDDGCG